ncbi:MAG: hypothetical protein HYR48_02740 [Gemmatimonadetes bacterium]|nr:hypothetical protein [Gemmatimonadota bacterium]
MAAERLFPWTALVEALGEQRFEELQRALGEVKIEPLERDAFLLNGAVGRLLRDLMPEEAPAEAVTAYGALVHALYLLWERHWPLARVTEPKLRAALESITPYPLTASPLVSYIQLPERLVWAEPEAGAPHEPIDGFFIVARAERLRALAVLGLHAHREGFTTVESETTLPAPVPGPRPDGSPPFASVLSGGDRAKLFSVTDAHELAALALLALAAAEG